jgi:hypothetical protein
MQYLITGEDWVLWLVRRVIIPQYDGRGRRLLNLLELATL